VAQYLQGYVLLLPKQTPTPKANAIAAPIFKLTGTSFQKLLLPSGDLSVPHSSVEVSAVSASSASVAVAPIAAATSERVSVSHDVSFYGGLKNLSGDSKKLFVALLTDRCVSLR
jgi:hypothetical protein